MFPVIFNNSSNDTPLFSACFLTVAKAVIPCCIFCNSKGVVAANLVTASKAFFPSLAEPNNAFSCTSRFSICIPASTKPFITIPAPRPIKAFFKLNTDCRTLANPACKPVKAFLLLSFVSFILIIYLIINSLEENVIYFKSPTEIKNLTELTKKKSKSWRNGQKKLNRGKCQRN